MTTDDARLPKRRYVSSKRHEQAEATKAGILDAAQRLFVDRGYARTSMHAVAQAAHIVDSTLFVAFKDKPTLLWAVVQRVLGGAEPEPEAEAALVEALRAEPDPRERLRMVMEMAREQYERGLHDLEAVLLEAASVDSRVQALTGDVLDTRLEYNRRLVSLILDGVDLPEGTSVEDVAQFIDAVDSASVYRLLTDRRGWTTDKYAEWMRAMFDAMFLAR